MSDSGSAGGGPEPLRLQIPSPIGKLGIELTGRMVTRVVLRPKKSLGYVPFLKVRAPTPEDREFLDEALGRLSEFLAGVRRRPELDYDLTPSGVSGFDRRVLKETARIPYGKTRTYQQIAQAAGHPQGYRIVLSSLMANPLPLVIPCHRVITSKSGVGSYIGGTRAKKWLLDLERKALANRDLGE
jgi:methylated-DNA-[protein]-cysteine S-methyltransferase